MIKVEKNFKRTTNRGKKYENNHYQFEVNLVTALVPSEIACLANSPGSNNLTPV